MNEELKPSKNSNQGPDGLHLDVENFSKGTQIEGVYMLGKFDLRKTKYGDAFFSFELSDRTGSIPARQWEANAEQFAVLAEAPVVYVVGVVDEWMNEIQLKVTQLEPVEASLEELRFLIPHTPYDVEQLFTELTNCFETLENPYLREMFSKVFADPLFASKIKETPAASSYHHNYLGGLLEHIVSLLRVSEQVLHAYPRLNRDLVLVGAFLHDIGKVEELSWERGFSYTTRGQLLGHIAIGTLLIEDWSRAVEGFPPDLKDELIHLVLAHHGIKEHGSPVVPCTPEALVVHFLDNLDGKLWSSYKAIDDVKTGTESWTSYSRHMGRKLYRRHRVDEKTDVVPVLKVERPNDTRLPVLEPGDLAPRSRVTETGASPKEDPDAGDESKSVVTSPAKTERNGKGSLNGNGRSRARSPRFVDPTPPLFG
ncbi:MAG: HD domain-containing protein [Planctomycetota bacterium]|nr:HD domain-containing protein [Planctomycetota bacterium]